MLQETNTITAAGNTKNTSQEVTIEKESDSVPDNLLKKQLEYLQKTLKKIREENKQAGKPLFKEHYKEEVAEVEVSLSPTKSQP